MIFNNSQPVYQHHRCLAEGEPFMRLRMAPDVEEVSHGMHRYQVDPFTHEVTVPPECGHVLLRTGAGAVWIDKPQEPEPQGEAVVIHADPEASFSFRGITYEPGEDGRLRIPLAAVADALSHGFTGPLIEEE